MLYFKMGHLPRCLPHPSVFIILSPILYRGLRLCWCLECLKCSLKFDTDSKESYDSFFLFTSHVNYIHYKFICIPPLSYLLKMELSMRYHPNYINSVI